MHVEYDRQSALHMFRRFEARFICFGNVNPALILPRKTPVGVSVKLFDRFSVLKPPATGAARRQSYTPQDAGCTLLH